MARMTRGERVIAFIERYCKVPEGKLIGQPVKLIPMQRRFILDVYDNPNGTSRGYLSIARKNGKTALIAGLVLAHLVGPEAVQNSQIVSGARSREQAALVYRLAEKMVNLNPDLSKIIKCTPSTKKLVGLTMNVEYHAISAEAGTAHGLSPILAILDEVGQIKGPHDSFVEAIETAQGAYENPLLIAISTQAATDADLFSVWIDDAVLSKDPNIVCHLYAAPEDCELDDRDAWAKANPALGIFRAQKDIENFSKRAMRQPSAENTFRWLYLNQRVEASAPFVSRSLWKSCGGPVIEEFGDLPVFGGLDLSSVHDLTARVYVAPVVDKNNRIVWNVKPRFWLPEFGLADKSKQDRVPYDVWKKEGFLDTTPGKTVDYEWVAQRIFEDCKVLKIQKIAFDRWNWKHLKPWLEKAGFRPEQLEGDKAIFVEFGQGFAQMSPALRDTEAALLEGRIAHGNQPVLTMCAANAVVNENPAGGRKLDKAKAKGRIDGMVALVMAMSMAGTYVPPKKPSFKMLVIG